MVRLEDQREDEELRREALLLAGELYQEAEEPDRALAAYQEYIAQFPEPLELAVETRFQIATLHDTTGDRQAYHAELERIVRIDARNSLPGPLSLFEAIEGVTAAAFGQRRKMLRQSLKSVFPDPVTVLEALEIAPTARAEELPPEAFLELAKRR